MTVWIANGPFKAEREGLLIILAPPGPIWLPTVSPHQDWLVICRARCKTNVQSSLLKNYEELQEGDSRTLSQVWGPFGHDPGRLHRSSTSLCLVKAPVAPCVLGCPLPLCPGWHCMKCSFSSLLSHLGSPSSCSCAECLRKTVSFEDPPFLALGFPALRWGSAAVSS